MIRLFAAAALAVLTGAAWAQQYPSRPITFVVPYPPGGQTDVEGRAFAESLHKRLGQPVIIDNRPGAGGSLAVGFVAKAPPDGYTILVGAAETPIVKLVHKDLSFDNQRDIIPVSLLTEGWSLILTPSASGAKTWNEFIALARKSPGKLNYATLGASAVSLAMGGLRSAAGDLPITPIPYKGGAEYVQGLLRNDVQLEINVIPFAKPHIEKGTLVPLLQIANARHPDFPNVPTTEELGYGAKIRPFAWTGVFVPRGTPQAVIDTIAGAAAAYAKEPEQTKRAQGAYVRMVGSTPAEFKKVFDADIAAWTAVAKLIGLQPE
jgi:tripartite-type tricarboxylate transporter receptor subunit TctC